MSFGSILTAATIHAAMAGWLIACAWLLRERVERRRRGPRFGGRAPPGPNAPARWAWTLGCAAYLAHVAAAFAVYHDWSHTAAYRHVAEGVAAHPWFGFEFGAGLYANYAFTVLWVADAAWWWVAPVSYRSRPTMVTWAVHAIFATVIVSATVVFESGAVRWVYLAVLLGLGAAAVISVRAGGAGGNR